MLSLLYFIFMHIHIGDFKELLLKKKREREDFKMRKETRAVNFHIYLYLENLDQLTREIKYAIIYSYLILYC